MVSGRMEAAADPLEDQQRTLLTVALALFRLAAHSS
jgi:hypothetical protein